MIASVTLDHRRPRIFARWHVPCLLALAVALFVLPAAIIANNTYEAERSIEAGEAPVEEEVKHTFAYQELIDTFSIRPPERRSEWPNHEVKVLPEGARRLHVPPPKPA